MPSKYFVDADNRLVKKDGSKDTAINGSFSTDKNNRLIFWLNEPPAWRRKYGFRDKVVFTGNWKLNDNYDLELWTEQDKPDFLTEALILKGRIISIESDNLVFEIRSQNKAGLTQFRLLKLTGLWNADAQNQLCFLVSQKGSPDILTLGGSWQVNKNQQITYTYQRRELKRKTRQENTLTFLGYWQITEARQLSYALGSSSASSFDFRAALQTPNIYPKKGVIKYRLGAGLREERKEKTRIVSLFGAWKLSRGLGLSFEMEYAKGEIHALEFDTEITLDRANRVVFQLKGKRESDLGMSVIFTHEFIKQLDAKVFLRLKHSLKESGVDVGVTFPF